MIQVTIFFPHGTFSSTAIGPMEVFRHSGKLWNFCSGKEEQPRFCVTTASIDGGAVECDGPLHIQPQTDIASIRKTDLILVPSTGLDMKDTLERNAKMLPWLKRWHSRGAAVAAVCSGVGLLAATGLLDGRRATTHWGLADALKRAYPKVKWMPEFMVTEDAGLYCGGGLNASMDLSLHLVEQFCGHEVAVQSAKAMLIDTPRLWQSGFAIAPVRTQHEDDAISQAQEWIHRRFARNFAMEEPAGHVGMSSRTFTRRFKLATGDSPLIYLQKVRVAAAKRLLENESRSLQEVSDAVGYSDVVFFRSIFRRHTGESPTGYRRRFC